MAFNLKFCNKWEQNIVLMICKNLTLATQATNKPNRAAKIPSTSKYSFLSQT